MSNWKYIWYDIKEQWERLNLRYWINDNPKIVIGISAVSVFVFLLIVITHLTPYKPPIILQTSKAWFYDLNTGKLFVADGDQISPIEAPSGLLADGQPAGVRAHVLSHIREPNESERFIGYLEKYTSDGKQIISSFRKSNDKVTEELVRQLNKNRLIRTIEDANWVSVDSTKGKAIISKASLPNEQGQTPIYYPPK